MFDQGAILIQLLARTSYSKYLSSIAGLHFKVKVEYVRTQRYIHIPFLVD